MITSEVLADKFAAIRTTLTERGLRLWASAEARSLGHGGIKMMAQITGLGRETVARGIRELAAAGDAESSLPPHASRRQGGGRKKLTAKAPTLLADLDRLVSPATRGHPESNPARKTSNGSSRTTTTTSSSAAKENATSTWNKPAA